MRTVLEIFGDIEVSSINYKLILKEFGDIILQVDDYGCQCDSRVLYKDSERIGYLQFGWGSCSGYEALQSCDNLSDVQTLMDNLFNSIKWFDSVDDALRFFKDHDWEGDYSWYSFEQKIFVTESITILKGFHSRLSW